MKSKLRDWPLGLNFTIIKPHNYIDTLVFVSPNIQTHYLPNVGLTSSVCWFAYKSKNLANQCPGCRHSLYSFH